MKGANDVRSTKAWNTLYSAISVVAVLCLIFPYYAIFTPAFALSLPLALLLLTVLYLVGYAAGKLMNYKKNSEYDFSYSGDSTEKPSLKNCALPGILVIGIAIALMFPVNRYIHTLPNFERYSFLPVEAFLLMILPLLCGVITSVRPFYQIVGFRTIITHFCIFLICSILLFQTGEGSRILIGCFLVWILCAAILFNQTYIVKSVTQARIGEVKSRSRLYNLGMLLALLLVAVVATGIAAVVFNGLYFLGRTILMVGLFSFFNREAAEHDQVVDETISEGELFGGGLFEDVNMNESTVWLFLLILLFVLFIAIFGRRLQLGKKLRTFFSNLLNALLSFFALAGDIFKGAWWNEGDDGKLPEDYKDIEGKQDRSAIYDRETVHDKRSYRAFMRQLSAKKSDSEKLTFAYANLVGCFREMPIGLQMSDTPREILEKVNSKLAVSDAEIMTDAYETIRYGEREGKNQGEMLRKICEMIRKYSGE